MINWFEVNLVFSNIIFIIPFLMFIYKKMYITSIPFIMVAIASSLYHTCFLPVHVISNKDLNMFKYCPVSNLNTYAMTLMFLDMFFAELAFLVLITDILPIHKIQKKSFRIFWICVGIGIIFVSANFLGFFPVNSSQYVSEYANYITEEQIFQLKEYGIWEPFLVLLSALGKSSKSRYLSLIVGIYSLIVCTFHFYMFWVDCKVRGKFYSEEIKKYYKTRFRIWFLYASLLCFSVGLFIWVVIEKIFPIFYEITHGPWHISIGIAPALYAYSLLNTAHIDF